jgi:hypothetical protein
VTTTPSAPLAPEAFVARYGDALAHNLAHHCHVAARDLVAALREAAQLPAGVEEDGVFRVLLSMRATLELMAVEQRFGTPAHDALLAAMAAQYERALLAPGARFVTWIRAAHETMRREPDARRWLARHAEATLGTREPEAGVLHAGLGYGLRTGDAIADVVAANVGEAGRAVGARGDRAPGQGDGGGAGG